MEVILPKKYQKIVENLPPFFKKELQGETIKIRVPIDCELDKTLLKMNRREFSRLFKEIKVSGGRKIRRGDKILLCPVKNHRVTIRFSKEEYCLLKELAKKRNVKIADYCRNAILDRLFSEGSLA